MDAGFVDGGVGGGTHWIVERRKGGVGGGGGGGVGVGGIQAGNCPMICFKSLQIWEADIK